MSILSKLTLTATSPREPITPLARKRIKLLQKLEQQIETAEAEARDEVFMEEIKRWVRNDGSIQLRTKLNDILWVFPIWFEKDTLHDRIKYAFSPSFL